MEKNDEYLKDLIAFYGEENMANPNQYPASFAFQVKCFDHYRRNESKELVPTTGEK